MPIRCRKPHRFANETLAKRFTVIAQAPTGRGMLRNAAHAELRARTRDDHETVDAAFARFDLRSRPDYISFLRAHAAVLPAIEQAVAPATLIPGWVGRTAALSEDFAALDAPMPPPVPFTMADTAAARWGALYVLEGSRLGGAMLARMVGADLPAAYLRSTHAAGKWRSLLANMDQAINTERELDEAVTSAKAVFVAYRRAAEQESNFVQ
jgi:heme oxygenase